jgi:HlyD family secretion protein
MKQQLFRKSSVDRLSSPEQLDEQIKVTSPRAWLALSAIGGILGTAVMWGFLGNVPSKVAATCILIRPGGLDEIVATGTGWMSDVSVDAGDLVKEGQLVARIDQVAGLEQIKSLEAKLYELNKRQDQLLAINKRSSAGQDAYLGDVERNLISKIKTAMDQANNITHKISNQEQLLDQGLITRQSLLNSKIELANVQQMVDSYQNEIKQISLRKIDAEKMMASEQGSIALQIQETKRSLATMMRSNAQSTLVYSPFGGRVLEIKHAEGAPVTAGTSIMTLEQIGVNVNDLEAVIFVPPLDGKRVKINMDVLISPSSVKREEYGQMIGKVTSVAEFPSSVEGMQRLLKNQQLVRQLADGAAPIAVRANLTPSGSTVSGYKWTSPAGPATKIESGTLCNATITVKNQRPVTLVIPTLKKYLGL